MLTKKLHKALLVLTLTVASTTAVKAQVTPAEVLDPRTLSRIPEVQRSDMNAADQLIYDKVAGLNRTTPLMGPQGVSLHMPKVAQAMDILNQYLRYDSIIGRRYIETAILVTAREFDQQYEWTFHEPTALTEGAPQAVVDAIKFNRGTEGLEPKDSLIIRYGRELLRDHHVSAATYAEAVNLFTQQGTLEIAAIIGDYALAAILLTAINQQVPPTMSPLLPAE
jgi:4-carboxymuconolactone decarboxylase